jgi:biopolymer transport protein ExbD
MRRVNSRVPNSLFLSVFATSFAAIGVLLVVMHIVVTPFCGGPITTPIIRSGMLADREDRSPLIMVRSDGLAFLNAEFVDSVHLSSALARSRACDASVVRIRADKRAPFGSVRAVVSAAQSAGCARVRFVTSDIAWVDLLPARGGA